MLKNRHLSSADARTAVDVDDLGLRRPRASELLWAPVRDLGACGDASARAAYNVNLGWHDEFAARDAALLVDRHRAAVRKFVLAQIQLDVRDASAHHQLFGKLKSTLGLDLTDACAMARNEWWRTMHAVRGVAFL